MATFRPHPYQAYAIDRIMNQANVGLFLDMGLGKTVITLTAVDRLIHQLGIVRHVLIIAPKKVAEATWQAEARKWDHLRGLTIATALGSAREREAAIDARAEITIINRENVAWLVEHYGQGWSERPKGAEPASAAKQDAGETRDPQSVARARGVVEISATSAAALTGKLLQLCGGAVYDEAGEVHHVHDAKLEALGELIEQLHGEHALLFYGYRHEVPRLESVLAGKKCGGWNRRRMPRPGTAARWTCCWRTRRAAPMG